MAKKITKIKVQKNDQQRYSIYLDGEFAFGVYEATLVKYSLLKGTELTVQRIEEIKQADAMQRAYQVAIRYLAHQQRTEKEVRQRLKKEEVSSQILDQVIDLLKEQQYIADQLYAESYTRNAIHYTRKGPKVVKRDLASKGVNTTSIDHALADYTSEKQQENAKELAQKYLQRLHHVSLKQAQQKVQVYLFQKGFDSETIGTVMSELSFAKQQNAEEDVLNKQAEKILRRIERNYRGYEKQQKLKSALFQKGFNIDAIERYIDEHLEKE